MKYLIYIILPIMLFYQFPNYWIFGWAVPEVQSIVMDSDGACQKWVGEKRDCSIDEIYLINNLYNLYNEIVEYLNK